MMVSINEKGGYSLIKLSLMSNSICICPPKKFPYGIAVMHGPHKKTLCDVHIWIKTLKKSLRFPLRIVELKSEETHK